MFGKDDETVVVAECKACAKLTRRTLQKDIEEFANLKGPISSAVRGHYGAGVKLKTVPVVTRMLSGRPQTNKEHWARIFRS